MTDARDSDGSCWTTPTARAHGQASAVTLPATSDAFDDDDGNVHEGNISRIASAGITTGTGDGCQPARSIRRDEMASFLIRTLNRLVVEDVASLPS